LTVTGTVNLLNTIGSTASTTNWNLNGGALTANGFQLYQGTNPGAQLVNLNFNGGVLAAGASDNAPTTDFLPALTGLTADVEAGGALIHTNGHTVTIAAALLHGAGSPDGGLAVSGSGTLTLTAASTYTGPTSVNATTLIVSGSLAGTDALSVTNGGKAELETPNDVNSTARVSLGGGALQTLASQTQTLGDLTLASGSSTLTLGATGSIIDFADSSSDTWTGALAINDWNGNGAALGGGGSDQIFIGSSADLSQAQLAEVTFINPTVNGVTYNQTSGALQLADGELVAAVPEPGAWAMVIGGMGVLAVWQRSRRGRRNHG
jgi:autotransporter-associated beta strand protein